MNEMDLIALRAEGIYRLTPHQYLTLRMASQRADDLETMAAMAKAAFRDLMAAYGLDSSQPYRWNDVTFALEHTHGDATRRS